MTGYPPPGGDPPSGDVPPPGGFPPPGGYQPQGGYQPPPMGFPSPTAPTPFKLRPGRIWYLVALAMFAAGLAWLIVSIVALFSTVNGLQRVPLPAGGNVHLGHSGGYTVYYEGPGAQSGQFSFRVRISAVPPGAAAVHLRQYGSSVTYNYGSHHGRAVFTLNVSRPGTFAVTVAGNPPAGSDLAFGGSIARGIVGILVPAVPLMVLGFVDGLVVFIIRIARKSSMRRAGAWT